MKERENVKNDVIDMNDGYRTLIREHFPNAKIITIKFHVLRLLTPAINTHCKTCATNTEGAVIKRLLLKNRPKLLYYERDALDCWLNDKPVLCELYFAKETRHAP